MNVRDGLPPRGPRGEAGRATVRRPPRHGGRHFVLFIAGPALLVLALLFAAATALRPAVERSIVDAAFANPGLLRLAPIAELVRQELGASLTDPAGTDPTPVEFQVLPGDTPASLAPRLLAAGLIGSQRAFLFVAAQDGLAAKLTAGSFLLRRTMTPEEVARALVEGRIIPTPVTFREGLRLEQLTAELETVESGVDPAAFYQEVEHPPAALLADYPWLAAAGLPPGASLEGFLYPATYPVKPTTSADQLVRMMLDAFYRQVGPARLAVPAARGLTFYQVLTLASIVEREAVVDAERPLIAGVYQNRLDRRRLLEADPTVIYGTDSVALRRIPLDQWRTYFFWSLPRDPLQDVVLPKDLAGYQTYRHPGLPPGPICSPSLASIDAALRPDTTAGYLFFVAIPDGSGRHAFARTYAEHLANLKKYGYR